MTAERLAGDIIAKCIAHGTVGNLYVNADMVKGQLPKADHQYFQDALRLLDGRGFIQYHKHGSCFGLEPTRYLEALDFALNHASEKRRAVLAQRDPGQQFLSRQEAEWAEEDAPPLTRADLASVLDDYVPAALLRREVAALRVELAKATAGQAQVVAQAPSDLGPVRADINALVNKLHAQREILDALRRKVEQAPEPKPEIAGRQDVKAFNKKLKEIQSTLDHWKRRGMETALAMTRNDRSYFEAMIKAIMDNEWKTFREEVASGKIMVGKMSDKEMATLFLEKLEPAMAQIMKAVDPPPP